MNAPQKSLLTLKRKPRTNEAPVLEERLHKVLANAGLGSRRMLEKRIQQGEIELNGSPAITGVSVRAGDRVILDGKQFIVSTDRRDKTQALIYHKPEGVVTTRDDPEGRPTVFKQLPPLNGARWVAVGRLDINTTGLLLLTTDGELANALMHPRNGLEREYLCRIHGEVPDKVIEKLKTGVELDDGPAHFNNIAAINWSGSHSWFRVVICEGRNREVRRLWESQGYPVSRLKRIRYGLIKLPARLRHNHYEPISEHTVKQLRQAAGLTEPQPVLTLNPVVHQRRVNRNIIKCHPENSRPVRWSSDYLDQARELQPFERIREKPARGFKKSRQTRKEVNGNRAHPERAVNPRQRKNSRGIAPGQELPSVRSWFAGEKAEGHGDSGRNRRIGGHAATGNHGTESAFSKRSGNMAPRRPPGGRGLRGNRSGNR